MGLEQVLREDEVLALYNESPSHAVGLEHDRISIKRIQSGYAVIIPHSGLRTYETT